MPATPLKITPEMREDFEKIDAWLEEHPGHRGPVPQNVWLGEATPLLPVDEGFLEVFTADQLHILPRPEWLIEGIIEQGGLSILAGPPGHGKTFLALDWALSLATGKDSWYGHALPGEVAPVLYILTEGFGWIDQRIEAWTIAHDAETPHESLGLVRQNISIFPGENNQRIKATLDDESSDINRLHRTIDRLRPRLVIFDTYARVTGGMDENSNSHVNALLPILTQWQQELGVSILFLHHSTKDRKGAVRGAGALEGAADVVMRLSKNSDDNPELSWYKVKNAEEPPKKEMEFYESGVSVVLKPRFSKTPSKRHEGKHREWVRKMKDPEFRQLTQRQQADQIDVSQGTISIWTRELKADEADGPEEPDVL